MIAQYVGNCRDSASVLRDFSRRSTDSSVKSGTIPEKMLDVLDLPGHHGRRDARVLEDRDAAAQLSERDPVQRGAGLQATA